MALLPAALPSPAAAQGAPTKIPVGDPNARPLPIAITDLVGATPEEARFGQEISSIVTADLERSGLFRPIDKRAFIPDAVQMAAQTQPRFSDWTVLNAEALVTGMAARQPDGNYRVEFRLWDVVAGTMMTGTAYRPTRDQVRDVAHRIADEIYQALTGESGYFNTQVVYIAESGPGNQRVKRLAIMDQDGARNRFLTDGRELVLTPRFSPAARDITYMSYFNNKPRVYLFNLDSGRRELLGDFPGMTFAPRFSPDGNSVVMSLAENGNTDIYRMDLRTRRMTQLTSGPSIDTAPSYSPDGSKIVFESDRGGTQQLYVMDANGGNATRITFGQGRYATPVWSPRGDLIAFTRQQGGDFYVGVIKPDGSGERMLSQSYHVEGPTWAPNGRVLMFFKEGRITGGRKTAQLYSIDLTGRNERQVQTATDASDPAWSSLLE